jgi:hypothetical protein
LLIRLVRAGPPCMARDQESDTQNEKKPSRIAPHLSVSR